MADLQKLPKLRAGDWPGINRNFKKLFSSLRLGPDGIPTFAELTLTTLTASRLMFADADKTLDSVEDLQDWIAGTSNQVITADDGDGSITLSTPQNIHTGASPTFVDMTLTAFDATETVSEILVDTINAGVLDAITLSDDGGRALSWTAGKVYTPAGNIVITSSGSGTCTDNATNYLIWTSGTTLTLQTTKPTSAEIPIAHISVAANDIWEVHEESLLDVVVYNMHHGMAESVPLFIASGLTTSEDTDATNPLDVVTAAGTYYHDMHEEHTVTEKKSRTTPMRRWFHSSSVWTNDTNTQIDNTQYDNGTDLTAVLTAKYYRSTFLISETEIHWIYPQESFNTLNAALLGSDPTIPTGLDAFPKTVTVIMKQGDTTFPTAGGDRWIDRRPLFGTSGGSSGSVADHGSLSGLTDDDHSQYLLVDGTRAMSGALLMGDQNITGTGNIVPTDSTKTLGTSGNLWNEIYLDGKIGIVSSPGFYFDIDIGNNYFSFFRGTGSDVRVQFDSASGSVGLLTYESDNDKFILSADLEITNGLIATSVEANAILDLNPSASGDIKCFADTVEGETRALTITGRPTGGTSDTVHLCMDATTTGKFAFIGANDSYAFDNTVDTADLDSRSATLHINKTAAYGVAFFNSAADGEHPAFSHSGFYTGESKITVLIGFTAHNRFGWTGAAQYIMDNKLLVPQVDTLSGELYLQGGGGGNVSCFGTASVGLTPVLKVSGYPSGGSLDTISMGFDATTTGKFNFTGANDSYVFDNKLETTGEIDIGGDLNHDGSNVGFYGTAPIAQAVLATGAGATVDNVITALQNLGLVKQA